MKIDIDYLKENAPSLVSPVLCTELEDNQKVRLLKTGDIKAGDELFAIDIYEQIFGGKIVIILQETSRFL